LTALSIIQQAASWLALTVPTSIFPSTDVQIVQLRSLLNEEAIDLCTWPDHNWVKLTKQTTFVTTATEVQTGAVPADFAKFIDDSMWDRTQDRPVWGPMTPQQWQQEKAGPTFTSMYYGFRRRGNDFLMTPTPTAGDTIAFEYCTNLSVYASGDVVPTKAAFTADTDTTIFDETLMARGVRWRFLSQKKLDAGPEQEQWLLMLQRLAARDGGMPKLSASRNYPWTRLSPFIPDGSWPG
jgi:hypothetical protein